MSQNGTLKSSGITPFLMFKENCAEAAEFYTAIFKNSKVITSDMMSAEFTLDGQRFLAFNGGPHFSFSEGVSFFVSCETQAEVDYYWDHLLAGGGVESQCGWLRDRFGLSWQIIPTTLQQLLRNPDRAAADRALQAMLKMQKIVIEDLQKAVRV